MIYIAICDDNKQIIGKLKKKVRSLLEARNIPAKLEIYTNSQTLLFDVEDGKHLDLVLSDIEMPYINGMQLASKLHQYLPNIIIFFITAYTEYAIDSYTLNIFRYIPKNEINERLPHALYDAIKIILLQEDEFYTILTHNCMEKLSYRDIVLIQRDGKNAIFLLKNNETKKERISLAKLYQQLNSKDFIFINRSDIINLSHIIGIYHNTIKLTGDISLPISENRLDYVKNSLREFWGNMF